MPLKHSLETALMIVLACLVLVSGIVAAILSSGSAASLLVWAAAFGILVFYPISLYPLFQARRADNTFRLLHFAPAAILVIALVLSLIAKTLPLAASMLRVLTWGGSLVMVGTIFVLMARYAWEVLRQWKPRMAVLASLLVPFAVAGALWEEPQVGTTIVASLFGSRSSSAGSSTSSASSMIASRPSQSLSEEILRMRLRRMQRRRDRLADRRDPVVVVGAVESVAAAQQLSASKPIAHNGNPHLPSSGVDVSVLLLLAIAGVSGAVHMSTKTLLRRELC